MKPRQQVIFGLCLIAFQLSCNNRSNSNTSNYETLADSTSAKTYASSSAAVENNQDSNRKFIRTADLKFKVKNVVQSTYNIEDIVNRHNGFVTYTDLTSTIDNTTTTPISIDSSLETIYYSVVNTITLRVPNTKLDTTLKDIATNIDYLDFRVIKAEDVALQILSNNLAEKRNTVNTTRLTTAIDTRGKKLEETTNAEEILSDKAAQSDNAFITNLSLKDQINFSTVTLSIYQRQAIKRELISNEKNITAYEPSLGSKLLDSLRYGWGMFEDLIVFVVRIWWLLLVGGIFYAVYKKYWQKVK